MSYNQADIILYQASGITNDPTLPFAEMIALKGKKILYIGKESDLDQFKGPNTRMISCKDRTVIPGFNDAHCHPISYAATLLDVDCSPFNIMNIHDIQTQIRKRAHTTPKKTWIRAAGYNDAKLIEKRHITRKELDDAAPDHPVILVKDSGTQCILNSLALKIIGISKKTAANINENIGYDPYTGEPNGLIIGRNERVEKSIPPINHDEILQGCTPCK